MPDRLQPDPFTPGAFRVLFGETAQSYVDPADPERLEFEYVQRLCEALAATVLARPDSERVRVVHIGGGGLTIPRWVEHRRPHTAQIVLEPDADLTAEVRRKLPLPRQSGIKVRAVGGREGLAAMPPDYADAVILDAFADAQVPAELTTEEFLDEVRLRLRASGIFAANVTDRAPFGWAKRFTAGVTARWASVVVGAEPGTWKGRRFGNLVVVAAASPLPEDALARQAQQAVFPYRLISGRALRRWLGGAQPWSDADATGSPRPPGGRGWYS
nr:fused MFS/spermidine synthase [Propionibacterium sp.]